MTPSTTTPAYIAQPNPWQAVYVLAKRELLRFFRQRNRVIGSVGTPLMFWLLFGLGLQKSFSLSSAGVGGQSFLQYYFAGTIMLILLFTAIFSSISIIEDRKEGFLQGVLVAPLPRWAMVLGKILGGVLIALSQGVLILLLSLFLPVKLEIASVLAAIVLMAVTAIALTSVGFIFAWKMDSTQGFHAIMNLVLMPMWLLSGGFFPIPATSESSGIGERGLAWVMGMNPLSYCVGGVRHLLGGGDLPSGFWIPSLMWCWIVSVCFAATVFWLATIVAKGRTSGDLL